MKYEDVGIEEPGVRMVSTRVLLSPVEGFSPVPKPSLVHLRGARGRETTRRCELSASAVPGHVSAAQALYKAAGLPSNHQWKIRTQCWWETDIGKRLQWER